ncbi:hypothetical protein GGR26_001815 [Lewinella marina]|uniref:Uncharacterized protein n=1 Tax=Neolewinella marina TaxID=438751 RepID=A0A2G0CDD2_9BACT|nr:hypothetical protein [Neolewinella marina]NJB86047.1 hypothetical protein [Neolewinella marina]PHK97988.1 hypothetical protein CGL56_12400 [Neolewinella marina]
MNRTELTTHLHALYSGVDPGTNLPAPNGSCLYDPDVRRALGHMLRSLADRESATSVITPAEVASLRDDLRDLGYEPTVAQLSKVLIGSASIVDPRIRCLPAFRKYRGVFPRRAIVAALQEQAEAEPVRATELRAAGESGWEEEDFFDTDPFDKLEAGKAEELGAEVAALGLRKATEKLPAYIQRARQRLPRAFEPWMGEERALLIEAMCYTNDAERLAILFGRSASAVRREGKRLIWKSRQKAVA